MPNNYNRKGDVYTGDSVLFNENDHTALRHLAGEENVNMNGLQDANISRSNADLNLDGEVDEKDLEIFNAVFSNLKYSNNNYYIKKDTANGIIAAIKARWKTGDNKYPSPRGNMSQVGFSSGTDQASVEEVIAVSSGITAPLSKAPTIGVTENSFESYLYRISGKYDSDNTYYSPIKTPYKIDIVSEVRTHPAHVIYSTSSMADAIPSTLTIPGALGYFSTSLYLKPGKVILPNIKVSNARITSQTEGQITIGITGLNNQTLESTVTTGWVMAESVGRGGLELNSNWNKISVPDLKKENILKDKNICGVVGTVTAESLAQKENKSIAITSQTQSVAGYASATVSNAEITTTDSTSNIALSINDILSTTRMSYALTDEGKIKITPKTNAKITASNNLNLKVSTAGWISTNSENYTLTSTTTFSGTTEIDPKEYCGTLISSNIKRGVNIYGVEGSLTAEDLATGTLNINKAGTINVAGKKFVEVPNLEDTENATISVSDAALTNTIGDFSYDEDTERINIPIQNYTVYARLNVRNPGFLKDNISKTINLNLTEWNVSVSDFIDALKSLPENVKTNIKNSL